MLGTVPHWFAGGVVTLLLVAKLVFAVAVIVAIVKVFEISRDVREIKKAVGGGSRVTPPQR